MTLLALGLFFCIALVLYAYIGYPLLLSAIVRHRSRGGREDAASAAQPPLLTMIVAAYNEEQTIERKIRSTFALDYESGKLELIVASDGSIDRTNEIVRGLRDEYPRLRLLELPRGGKAAAINAAVPAAAGSVLVFSDANTFLDQQALRQLVLPFADPAVAWVCGKLVYRNPGSVVSGEGESFYWRYETALKRMESRVGYVAGANGALYAIRKELFEPLPPGTINDDFVISMRLCARGGRSVFAEAALAYEEVAPSGMGEFKRHVRDAAGHYLAMLQLAPLLNPALGWPAFIYWSHRVLRWIAPFLLLLIFALNALLLSRPWLRVLFQAQLAFYGLALFGAAAAAFHRLPFPFYVPFYFCNLNLALLLGFFKAVGGRQSAAWERTERRVDIQNSNLLP